MNLSYYFHVMRGMALFKFLKRKEKSFKENSLLARKEVESADKAVAKALESASKRTVRGKYNNTLQNKGLKLVSMLLKTELPTQQSVTLQRGGLTLMNQQQGDSSRSI